MAFANPPRPRLHLPWHLHIARWVAIAFFVPVSVAMAFGSVFLWQLSRGPVDVTWPARLFAPVAIASGAQAGHPAGRLTWARLSLAWQPASRGMPSGLALDATDLRILRLDGSVADHADEARTVLSLSALIQGVLSPRTLALRGASFALHRASDGGLDLDLPNQKRHGRGTPIRADRLTALDVQDVRATISGLPGRQMLRLDPVAAHFRVFAAQGHNHEMLWSGWARATLLVAGQKSVLTAQAVPGVTRSRWTIDATPVLLSGLAAVEPDLAAYRVPVGVHLAVDASAHGLTPDIREVGIGLHVGAGLIAQGVSSPLRIDEASLSARVTSARSGLGGAILLDIPQMAVVVSDGTGRLTHVGGTALIHADDLRQPDHIDVKTGVRLDGFDFATVGAIWPQGMMRGARRWVVRNIVQGTAQGLNVHARLHSDHGFGALEPTSLGGGLDAHDLTVWWLRPIAPATGVDAHLSLDGPDALTVSLRHAHQPDGAGGNLLVPDGRMRIAGLLGEDQDGAIDATLEGALPSFLTVLAHPRLHLLSRHPLPFTHPAGTVVAHVHLTLPLRMSVSDSDIHVQVAAGYHDVHLGSALRGRPVDAASGSLSATESGLTLQGDGRLAGIATHFLVRENFEGGAPDRIRQDITGSALIDPQSAVTAGIGPGGLFTGTAALSAHYVEHANDHADLALALDLANAGITLPIWSKPPGEPATVSAHLGFDGADITTLDALQAHGATLDIAGRAVVTAGSVRAIVLEGFRIGRSEGNAHIDLPARANVPVAVTITADPLDLAPLFTKGPADRHDRPAGEESYNASSGGWDIALHARRVFYASRSYVGDVTSRFALRDGKLVSGQFSLEAPTHLTATLLDHGADHPFTADIVDFGALLGSLGLYDRIGGGTAHIAGHFTDISARGGGVVAPEGGERDARLSGLGAGLPPFSGTLTMGKFALLHPPAALMAVSFLSPLQWPSDHGDRFEVDRLSMPVRLAGRVLRLHDGVIGNASLGATVQGTTDLDTSALALTGTIVPLFGLNALPGRLPGVGRALAPEHGGGMLAATFSVSGTVSAPRISVNPLSMLLPGVLRNIFK